MIWPEIEWRPADSGGPWLPIPPDHLDAFLDQSPALAARMLILMWHDGHKRNSADEIRLAPGAARP